MDFLDATIPNRPKWLKNMGHGHYFVCFVDRSDAAQKAIHESHERTNLKVVIEAAALTSHEQQCLRRRGLAGFVSRQMARSKENKK